MHKKKNKYVVKPRKMVSLQNNSKLIKEFFGNNIPMDVSGCKTNRV